jgi:hypothetical protein
VNPGLWLANAGFDMELTPRLRSVNNINLLWFNHTQVLEQFAFQSNINNHIGTDISSGLEYRPFLNDNVIMLAGVSGLIPGKGFEDLFSSLSQDAETLFAGFMEVALTY